MIQMSSVIGDIKGNLKKIIAFAEEAKGSDIICFPELSLTGYRLPDSAEHAISADDSALKEISAAASKQRAAIAFGFAERDPKGVYISQCLADNGKLTVYRKTHLGKFERAHFTPGDKFTVADTKKAKAGFQICAESHFPEISTCLTYRGAEIILMPFASPLAAEKRIEVWKKYLPARAYDNGVFVAACNNVSGNKGGGAIIIDPKGNVIAEDAGTNAILTADLKGSMLHRVHIDDRKSMNETDFFGSRRPELYSDVVKRL